jgi:hexosaminidase
VRLLPEFDTPGHTAAVGQAYPDLITDCYDWLDGGTPAALRWPQWDNVVLDVTKNATKSFVRTLFGEIAALFPDSFMHVGGDEVQH